MRSKDSRKPLIPCLDDPVTKLEGLGERTRRNLLEVRACAASLDLSAYVPEECPDTVKTGMHSIACSSFCSMLLEMRACAAIFDLAPNAPEECPDMVTPGMSRRQGTGCI